MFLSLFCSIFLIHRGYYSACSALNHFKAGIVVGNRVLFGVEKIDFIKRVDDKDKLTL